MQSLAPCLTPEAVHMAEQLEALGGGNARIGRLEVFVRVRPALSDAAVCVHEVEESKGGKEAVVRVR